MPHVRPYQIDSAVKILSFSFLMIYSLHDDASLRPIVLYYETKVKRTTIIKCYGLTKSFCFEAYHLFYPHVNTRKPTIGKTH